MTSTKRSRAARALAILATVFWTPAAMADGDRIEATEAKQVVEKGQALVVDVRSKDAFNSGHIEGAISLPLAEIDARLGELPKDKMIVTYCTCGGEASSLGAVTKLRAAGYTKVAALKGGLSAWQTAGGKVSAPAH
jgi:rhodanese-related sulfurtransferase